MDRRIGPVSVAILLCHTNRLLCILLETQAICLEQKKKKNRKKLRTTKNSTTLLTNYTMYKTEIMRTILQLLLGNDEFVIVSYF